MSPTALSPAVARFTPRRSMLALTALLLAGIALRTGGFLFQTHVLFFDETLQYFEQGHRLTFGAGIVPWEFHEGIRSWLLPGMIAGLMRITAPFVDDPMVYIALVRILCAILSLVIVIGGFRAGHRHDGRLGALLTGGLCAIWFDLIYFAPAAMTEVIAAHCAVAALLLGEGERPPRRLILAGGLLGLAVCLRYQYAPALALAAAWQYWRVPNQWCWLAVGGGTAILLIGGMLDALTLGTPFQSIWLNFSLNASMGIASAISTEPSGYYLTYLMTAFMPLPLFLGLAMLGATRSPALAIAALAVLVMHSLVPHKEARFIYLTIATAPILIGLGSARVLRLLQARFGTRAVRVGAPVLMALFTAASCFNGGVLLGPRWSFQRGTVHAFLAAHGTADLCGLQVRGIPPWRSGGYTYLHRDVPLSFDPPFTEVRLPGVPLPLRFTVDQPGRLTGSGAAGQSGSMPYSHVIAPAASPPSGFDPVICFPEDARPGDPELCLFRRPAGCSANGSS